MSKVENIEKYINKNALEEIREATKTDLKEKLQKHKRCCVIRPTGFGKTWLLSDLTKDYKSVLYVYPAEIIRKTAVSVVESISNIDADKMVQMTAGDEFDFMNIKFMTYNKLAIMDRKEIRTLPDYDLIIFDEMHKLGGPLTKKSAIYLLQKQNKHGAHVVGATATPERSDAFDVISNFFKGITVDNFSLHDAIKSGILQKPYYVYCTYDIEKSFLEDARKIGQEYTDPKVQSVVRSSVMELATIYNMPKIIRSTIDECKIKKNYQKYIVFFSSISQLNEKVEDVKSWFEDAFPGYKVNTLSISSESKETRENLEKLNLAHHNKTIDLICCVDMLNMGYHVSDITGVVMYRCTSSSIIYIQQLGRALSSGNKNKAVVFDIVDNLHRRAIFCLNENENSKENNQLPSNKSSNSEDDIDTRKMTKKERVAQLLDEFKNELSKEEIKAMEKFINDELQADDRVAFKQAWNKVNHITAEDLFAIDHLATYREFIGKVVVEAEYERRKRAAQEWLRHHCGKKGSAIPKTMKEVREMSKLDPELKLFAHWQSVSETDVLDSIEDKEHPGMANVEFLTGRLKKKIS